MTLVRGKVYITSAFYEIIMKRGVRPLFYLLSIVMLAGFAFAAHTITTSGGGTTFNFDEDVSSLYNVSVFNTDTGVAANITQVNITFPSSFTFSSGTNGTDAGAHTFTSSSTVLSWTNDGLVMNSTENHFFFNLTASTPGTYNLTVLTVNATGTQQSNLSVTIDDLGNPGASFISPTDGSSNAGTIILNASITDAGTIDEVLFNVTNSSGSQDIITATNPSGDHWNATLDTTDFADGNYNITIYANDTGGNLNNTARISVTFDNTDPSASLSEDSSTRSSITVSTSCSDATSSVTCSLSSSEGSVSGNTVSDLSCGNSYTLTATATDDAGNSASASESFSTDDCSSGGGLIGEVNPWVNTYVEDSEELISLNKQLSNNERARLLISGEIHHVGVKSIGDSSVTVEVSSNPQEVTLDVGETRRFEISGDNYYDLSVTLNSIIGNKADLTMNAIHEAVETTDVEQQDPTGTGEINDSEGKSGRMIWLWIVIVLIIAAGIVLYFVKFRRNR